MGAPDLFMLLKKVWHKHGWSSTLTRNALSLGAQDAETGWYAKSYAQSNIEMYVITKATQYLVLKTGIFISYDGQGYTKDTVKEGDILNAGPDNEQYLVISVCDRNILSQFRYNEVGLIVLPGAVTYGSWKKWDGADGFFNRLVRNLEKNSAKSAFATLYKLSLGSQDAETGWYTPSYDAGTQIKCPILDSTNQTMYKQTGIYTFYTHIGYSIDDVFPGDIIKEQIGLHQFHRVREVKTQQIGDHLICFELHLEYLDPMTVSKFGIS